MDTKKYKVTGSILKAENSDGSIRIRLISDALDRDSEVLMPKGAVIKNWKSNPVWLWAHNIEAFGGLARPPIGKGLVDTVEQTDQTFDLNVMFDEKNDPFAKMVADKHRDGFLNASSVGFMPITVSQDIHHEGQKGVTHLKFEVFEGSSVPIPSNPTALQLNQAGEFFEKCKGFGFESKHFDRWFKVANWSDEMIEDATISENVKVNLNYEIIDLSKDRKTNNLDPNPVKLGSNGSDEGHYSTYSDEEFTNNSDEILLEEHLKHLYSQLESQFEALGLIKIGAVLSKKNKAIIQGAHDALGKLIEADKVEEPKEDEKVFEELTALLKSSKEFFDLSNSESNESDILKTLNDIKI